MSGDGKAMGDVWDAIQRPKSLVVGDGCVWDGHSFFFKFMHSNRMQGMQQRYKHRGGCVGVVRRNRNHYGVGWGRIWCWWTDGCRGGGLGEGEGLTYKIYIIDVSDTFSPNLANRL